MKLNSNEFRRDVLWDCDSGKGALEVALKFNVSDSWVRRINQQRRETGKIAPVTTHNKQTKWVKHPDAIRKPVAENPDRTELLSNLVF